jgi:hypothetical protein
LGKLKKFIALMKTWTSDLPACSIMPQPSVLPHPPRCYIYEGSDEYSDPWGRVRKLNQSELGHMVNKEMELWRKSVSRPTVLFSVIGKMCDIEC